MNNYQVACLCIAILALGGIALFQQPKADPPRTVFVELQYMGKLGEWKPLFVLNPSAYAEYAGGFTSGLMIPDDAFQPNAVRLIVR